MFNTGFSRNIPVIAEDEHGETGFFLSSIAKTYHINLIAGYSEKAVVENKGRNVAAVYDRNGVLVTKYTKIHPFSFTGEDRYFMPGNRVVLFSLEGMAASLFICYDLRFPEIFRVVARDVQAIFVIANWPSARSAHWETLLKARAIENQCFVIGVNRIGTDGYGLVYPGASHVFDPVGNDLCAGGDTEEFLIVEFSPDDVHNIRASFPALQDMHPISLDILKEN
jgi:predicted amidohydrolase